MPLEAFLTLWARASQDRDFAGDEESSRQAGAQLQAFLASLPSTPGPARRSPTAGSRPTCYATCSATMPCPRTCWMRAYHRAPSLPLTT